MTRLLRLAVVLVVFTGLAVTCGGPTYDDPSDLTVPVSLTALDVGRDGHITIATEVVVPPPPAEREDPLERIEISLRSAGGTEYLRAVYNASSWSVNPVAGFGLYPIGEVADPDMDDAVGSSHDADTLWGAIHRDTTDRDRTSDVVRLIWVVSLLDVPLGDYEVWAKAVPGRQRDREFAPIGSFTLTGEDVADAGIHRDGLQATLDTGTLTTGDTSFSVADLWTLYRSLLERPDVGRAGVRDAGESSFLRFLVLLTERGTPPANPAAAMPEVDIAAATADPDPWIAAPALFLARKLEAPIPTPDVLTAMEQPGWDATAIDQALLLLAPIAGESVRSLPDVPAPVAVELGRIESGWTENCTVAAMVAGGTDDAWTVRLQRPTTAGLTIEIDGEPMIWWDGDFPIGDDPGTYVLTYLEGDPPLLGGPVAFSCGAGQTARVVIWREGGV